MFSVGPVPILLFSHVCYAVVIGSSRVLRAIVHKVSSSLPFLPLPLSLILLANSFQSLHFFLPVKSSFFHSCTTFTTSISLFTSFSFTHPFQTTPLPDSQQRHHACSFLIVCCCSHALAFCDNSGFADSSSWHDRESLSFISMFQTKLPCQDPQG